ncbi:MAG: hypothetical protein ACLGI6_01135 [Gammaproteobacteria bacterium]
MQRDTTLRSRNLYDRRVDLATAATVEVALIYLDVFGADATRQYLATTDIPSAIARRIVLDQGQRRQR